MTDLLEQMKTRAEQAQTAYEAYKAECEKVEELPEVFYFDAAWPMGWHFKEDCTTSSYWCGTGTDFASYKKRSDLDIDHHVKKVTAAEYNNARALYHGADFTGRLHEIDRPVCELNKATRDEMDARGWDAFEVKTSYAGWTNCVNSSDDIPNTEYMMFDEPVIYRLRAPKKRPMTRKEVLAWASSEAAFGWVTKWGECAPCNPQCQSYILDSKRYQRAPIATLNDDGTGGEWEAFEVQA